MRSSFHLAIALLVLAVGCAGDQRQGSSADNHGGGETAAHKTFTEDECREIAKCLPADLTLDTPFATNYRRSPTTVRIALEDIGARCKDGRLVDPAGTEIYFFQVPEGEQSGFSDNMRNESFRRAGDRLHSLRERYHVIEMYALTRLPSQ